MYTTRKEKEVEQDKNVILSPELHLYSPEGKVIILNNDGKKKEEEINMNKEKWIRHVDSLLFVKR